jgi:hypothetical protein
MQNMQVLIVRPDIFHSSILRSSIDTRQAISHHPCTTTDSVTDSQRRSKVGRHARSSQDVSDLDLTRDEYDTFKCRTGGGERVHSEEVMKRDARIGTSPPLHAMLSSLAPACFLVFS